MRITSSQHCFRCGSSTYIANPPACKARKQIWRECSNIGHSSSVCNSENQLREATETGSSDTEAMKNVLGVQQKKLVRKSSVCVTLTVEGRHITFLVDIASYRSSVSVINTYICSHNFVSQELKPAASSKLRQFTSTHPGERMFPCFRNLQTHSGPHPLLSGRQRRCYT